MEKLHDLIQKDMTRREFLATVGFGLASLFGLAALLRLLTGRVPQERGSYGYGHGSYGGHKNT